MECNVAASQNTLQLRIQYFNSRAHDRVYQQTSTPKPYMWILDRMQSRSYTGETVESTANVSDFND